MNDKPLIRKFIRMFGCDTARLAHFPGRVFLIVGRNWHTKKDSGQWFRYEDGEMKPFDFAYLNEKVIASGRNAVQLVNNAKAYKKLLKGSHVFS